MEEAESLVLEANKLEPQEELYEYAIFGNFSQSIFRCKL